MKKQLVRLLFSMVLFLGFPSCEDDLGSCGKVDEFFDIHGIEIDNYHVREIDFEDGSNWQAVKDGETVPFENFFMRIYFEVDYYPETQALLNIDFSPKAYALSCREPGYKGSKEKVDTLYIVTNNDFSEYYAAGDTINEIVEVNDFVTFYSDIEDFRPLSSYFEENQENIHEELFSLKLNQEPTYKQLSHSFTIIYKLENGEVYAAATEIVKFK